LYDRNIFYDIDSFSKITQKWICSVTCLQAWRFWQVGQIWRGKHSYV